MKIPAIKKIIEENYTLEMLDAAEEALINEEKPSIEIDGDDDGDVGDGVDAGGDDCGA